eukprot:g11830.t1
MRSSPTSPKERQQAAYQARLEAEGDFLQQVNAGVKSGPGEGPKWKTVTTSFPQDDAGRQKWAGVHKANIVAEAVSECRDFSRPLAEFRVMELAPQHAEGSAGLMTDVKRGCEEKHQYKVNDQLRVVGGTFDAKNVITNAKVVVTETMECTVAGVEQARGCVGNKITMFTVEDAGEKLYLKAKPEICKNHLRPVVGPVWVRAHGPVASSTMAGLLKSLGRVVFDISEKAPKTNRDMLGKRFQVLTLAKDYLARFGAATRVGAGGQKVSSALMRAVLDPGEQEQGTCEIAAVHPGDFPSNPEQKTLVTSLGNNRITVAQGPPGTGKSTTIYHIVNALGQEYEGGCAALVTCVTNTAINSIVEKLKECEGKGVHSLVLGNKDRVGADAAMFLLDEKVKRDEAILMTATLRSKLEKEYVQPKVALKMEAEKNTTNEVVFAKRAEFVPEKAVLAELQKMWKFVESKIEADLDEFNGPELDQSPKTKLDLDDLVRRVDKLCEWARDSAAKRIVSKTTCFLFTIASGYRMQQLADKFHDTMPYTMLAILDEAGATAESYAPMLLGAMLFPILSYSMIEETGVENLVLLGDTMQLRPLVKGEPPQEAQVDRSLMERCCAAGADQLMLKEQYRMPEEICNVVSALFYKNELRTGPNKKNNSASGGGGGAKITEQVLCWVDVKRGSSGFCGSSSEYKVGTSWCSAEQAVVALMWAKIRKAADPGASVFIICMYKPQVRLLQRVADKLGLLSEGKRTTGATRILSVDACQGSEADHVILVTTRSNPHNNIGFVKNPNRANVAISRSKKTLTVIGDRDCMAGGSPEIWGQVARKCKLIVSKQGTSGAVAEAAEEIADAVETELKRMGGTDSKCAGGKAGGKGAGKRTRQIDVNRSSFRFRN